MSTRRNFITTTTASAIAFSQIAPRNVMGANDSLRIGVIGCGDRGTSRARTAKRLGAEIVALADVNKSMQERCDHELDQKSIHILDHTELLAHEDIDGVIAAPPDHWHYQVLMDAIKAKKDVYIEKPLSRTIEEGREMVKAVQASKQVVTVGNHRRSGKHWATAHDKIKAGEIGEIKWVRTWDTRYRLVDPYQDRAKDKDLYNPEKIDWKRFLGTAPNIPFDAERCSAWRWYWDYAGGLMTDIGPHMLDVAMWLTECQGPNSVVCNGGNYHYPRWETPDNVHAILDCGTFSIVFDVQFMNGYDGDGAAFFGTEGSIVQGRDGNFRRFDTKNNELEMWEGGDEGTAHMENWLDCIRSRKEPNSPVEMGNRVIVGAHLANIGYREGKRVDYDPINEKIM
jgi:predicted dehydrogenase